MSEDKISMNHGAGGEVMANLISSAVLDNITKKSVNGGISLDALDDGATIPIGDYEIVVTTDGHTIDPLFFPGGDIGRISAAGTINDVSVMGAKPLAISNAIIMQEGFPIADLDRIMKSLNETCEEVDVAVITGDTKVMEQGKIDGIVMVTTGIGIAKKGEIIRDSTLEVGDKIIVTGSLGDHGMSLMSFREGFGFETDLKSDTAPMWNVVKKALDVGGVTAMKDPTRGVLQMQLMKWLQNLEKVFYFIRKQFQLKKKFMQFLKCWVLIPLKWLTKEKSLWVLKLIRLRKFLKQLKLKNMEKMQLLLVKLLKEIMLLLKLQLVGKEYLKLQ